MNEDATSKGKALALCLIPFFILLYFVFGAASNGIFIPDGDGAFTLSGQAAWLACLFPLLWLTGDIIRHYPGITLSGAKRKLLAAFLTVVGVVMFFYAVIY